MGRATVLFCQCGCSVPGTMDTGTLILIAFAVSVVLYAIVGIVIPGSDLPDSAIKHLRTLPGPKPLPLLGNILDLGVWKGDFHMFLKRLTEYGQTFGETYVF